MVAKNLSLLEAGVTQSFFSQTSNMDYLGKVGKVTLSYLNNNGVDSFSVTVDPVKQSQITEDQIESGIKSLSIYEAEWMGWFFSQVKLLKNNYQITQLGITYDDANPYSIEVLLLQAQ